MPAALHAEAGLNATVWQPMLVAASTACLPSAQAANFDAGSVALQPMSGSGLPRMWWHACLKLLAGHAAGPAVSRARQDHGQVGQLAAPAAGDVCEVTRWPGPAPRGLTRTDACVLHAASNRWLGSMSAASCIPQTLQQLHRSNIHAVGFDHRNCMGCVERPGIALN